MARGRPRKQQVGASYEGASPVADQEVTPQYMHARKLAEEEAGRVKSEPVSVTYEKEVSSFGRVKYRRVTRMDNGNVYRVAVSQHEFKQNKAG